MECEKYLVKGKNLDLISSLKMLKKSTLKELFEEYEADNIKELKESILDSFEKNLLTCDFKETKKYFIELLDNENGLFDEMNYCDLEEMLLFIYMENENYHYYIPNEIKYVIRDVFII